jgi:hypothetical protein
MLQQKVEEFQQRMIHVKEQYNNDTTTTQRLKETLTNELTSVKTENNYLKQQLHELQSKLQQKQLELDSTQTLIQQIQGLLIVDSSSDHKNGTTTKQHVVDSMRDRIQHQQQQQQQRSEKPDESLNEEQRHVTAESLINHHLFEKTHKLEHRRVDDDDENQENNELNLDDNIAGEDDVADDDDIDDDDPILARRNKLDLLLHKQDVHNNVEKDEDLPKNEKQPEDSFQDRQDNEYTSNVVYTASSKKAQTVVRRRRQQQQQQQKKLEEEERIWKYDGSKSSTVSSTPRQIQKNLIMEELVMKDDMNEQHDYSTYRLHHDEQRDPPPSTDLKKNSGLSIEIPHHDNTSNHHSEKRSDRGNGPSPRSHAVASVKGWFSSESEACSQAEDDLLSRLLASEKSPTAAVETSDDKRTKNRDTQSYSTQDDHHEHGRTYEKRDPAESEKFIHFRQKYESLLELSNARRRVASHHQKRNHQDIVDKKTARRNGHDHRRVDSMRMSTDCEQRTSQSDRLSSNQTKGSYGHGKRSTQKKPYEVVIERSTSASRIHQRNTHPMYPFLDDADEDSTLAFSTAE